MSAGRHSNLHTAIAEGRVLRRVRETPGVRGDTLVGTVEAHTIVKDGTEMIRVTRVEAYDMTVEQWQAIAEGLHLDTVNAKD